MVILEPKKIKSSLLTFFLLLLICHEVIELDAMIYLFIYFRLLSFKPAFSLSSFSLIKRLFSSFLLSATRVVSFQYLRLLVFLLETLIPAYTLHINYISRVTTYSLVILLSQF